MGHAFRAAVERRDLDAMVGQMAEDVLVHSPVTHRPFVGRDAAATLFTALLEVFEDFRYTDELTARDGTVALVFRARVGDRELEGVDLLRPGEGGKVTELTVLVRPASGLMALAEAMGPRVANLPKAR